MDDLIRSLTLRPEPWSAGQILLNTTLAFLLGLFIAWVYRTTHRQMTVSFSFVNTLVIVSMIMALVMMVIGNNIARAFGLAGAMSIIRFRTVVKDTRDTAFVFFSLGAGMAAGTGNLKIAVIGTLLTCLFIGFLHWSRHGAMGRSSFLLSFDVIPSESEEQRNIFLPVFRKHLKTHQLVNVKSVRTGELLNLTFQVQLLERGGSDALVRDLAALEGVQRVALSYGEEAEV